ncbi:ROK family transcriptional regulator [Micromonospora sp. NBS 11-29]|uniref:ROK family transcriptional regulator n=1 Tax=Micromonospora sp. NBS 11-29 TaxID=1960879 RepID=UPI000B76E8DD|nr:ROK family transcriptional regulator [Micromonospora sp. NBS 11-29]
MGQAPTDDAQAPTRTGRRTTLLSSEDVGAANRAKIMQALADHGPLSRAELARMAGVPRGTIGVIVSSLIESELLQETRVRRTTATVGQPPRPLWFGPRLGPTGAVVIQPGTVRTAVVDVRGRILAADTATFPVDAGGEELERLLTGHVLGVLAPFAGRIAGTGVTVPAICDPATGEILACTPLPGLVGSGLSAQLARLTGAPVTLEEDVRALALGQRWFGRAQGAEDFVALQLGPGIGAAIMSGGRLLRGDLRISEIGHTCVNVDGERCPCGLTGCWETIASTRWLRREAARRGVGDAASTTPAELVALAEKGDRPADELLDDYADHVAVGIANLVHMLALSLFILHGDVVGGGVVLRDRVRAAVDARVLPQLAGRARVEFSELDQEAGLLGAAAVVITHQLGIVA